MNYNIVAESSLKQTTTQDHFLRCEKIVRNLKPHFRHKPEAIESQLSSTQLVGVSQIVNDKDFATLLKLVDNVATIEKDCETANQQWRESNTAETEKLYDNKAAALINANEQLMRAYFALENKIKVAERPQIANLIIERLQLGIKATFKPVEIPTQSVTTYLIQPLSDIIAPSDGAKPTAPTRADIQRREKIVRGLMPSLRVIGASNRKGDHISREWMYGIGNQFESDQSQLLMIKDGNVSDLYVDDIIFTCYQQAVESLAEKEHQLKDARQEWVTEKNDDAKKAYNNALVNFLTAYDGFIVTAVIPLIKHIETLLNSLEKNNIEQRKQQDYRMQVLSNLIRARKYTKFLPYPWRDYAQELCDKASITKIEKAHAILGASSKDISSQDISPKPTIAVATISASLDKKRKLSRRVEAYYSFASWVKGLFTRLFLPAHLRLQLDLVKAYALSKDESQKTKVEELYGKIQDSDVEYSDGIRQFAKNPIATYILKESSEPPQTTSTVKQKSPHIVVGKDVPQNKENNKTLCSLKEGKPEYQVMSLAYRPS